MSLNIKNERAHELATELARLTGESLTTAVVLALEMRLEAERERRGKKGKAERMLEFARKFAAGMPPSLHSEDHAALLYGEDGLPK